MQILRRALDGWLHTLELQELGLNIRLVKASDLPDEGGRKVGF